MAAWLAWLIAAGVLFVGEVFSLTFLLGPLGVAALLAAGAAAIGASVAVQIAVFIAGSLGAFLFIRPIAKRHLHTPAQLRTGTAALVGQNALVLEAVDADSGRIKLGGEVWSARAFDGTAVIEPGTRVQVIQIEGATAVVAE